MVKRDERHRYGQHYTPVEVARLLAAFAVRAAGDLVFDPACGDGRLLAEAINLKRRLAPQAAPDLLAREVFGVDRSAQAVAQAVAVGAQVEQADFFDLEPGARLSDTLRLPQRVDAIIGNPPYIRQEVMGAQDKRRIARRLASDRQSASEVNWPRWSGRSDIYVYFFARAVRFLKAGGRLVFLTASSWLDAGYGAALRRFLLDNFRVVAVIESVAESFFADASVNTCITVLEREPDGERRDANVIRFVQLTAPLAAPLALARAIEHASAPTTTAAQRIRMVSQAALAASDASAGWGKYLRADDIFFRILERGGARLLRLSELAQVRFGVKTGANEFFYLKDSAAKQKMNGGLLTLDNIARVRRGLTTGANEFFYLKAGASHRIEARFLVPVVFSLKEIHSIWLTEVNSRRLFFNCALTRDELRGTRALAYIRSGERAGYHLRPTCAARDHWYAVTRSRRPAPLILPSKVGERWLVAVNRAGVFEDKKLYGVYPRRGVSVRLLAAMLNSTWARYYAEVTCRQMTGAQAIADIDVAVAAQLLIPDPSSIAPSLQRRLESALTEMAHRRIGSVFDEVRRADRRRLDELVLAALGFKNSAERRAALNDLYAAVTQLVRARIEKVVVSGRLSVASDQSDGIESQAGDRIDA